MISGCQGSHIFEVVFIPDRRQPTFTIVAEVNGSFFLFSQCSCHCYSFACDELSQVVSLVRGVLGQQHSTHRQRTQKTENCSLRCRRLLSCLHAPLGPRASLLTLKTAVWQTTPRSLKKKCGACYTGYLDSKQRAVSHDPKARENSSRNGSRD